MQLDYAMLENVIL